MPGLEQNKKTKTEDMKMFRVIIDGKEIGKYKKVSFAKKQANLELELGGFFCEIYRGNKLYAYRKYNTEWR